MFEIISEDDYKYMSFTVRLDAQNPNFNKRIGIDNELLSESLTVCELEVSGKGKEQQSPVIVPPINRLFSNGVVFHNAEYSDEYHSIVTGKSHILFMAFRSNFFMRSLSELNSFLVIDGFNDFQHEVAILIAKLPSNKMHSNTVEVIFLKQIGKIG